MADSKVSISGKVQTNGINAKYQIITYVVPVVKDVVKDDSTSKADDEKTTPVDTNSTEDGTSEGL